MLAFHKNASNVYEKLIVATDTRRMNPQQLGAFHQRLLQDTGNRAEPGPLLDRLIPHQYGNYIVNSCLVVRFPPHLRAQALGYLQQHVMARCARLCAICQTKYVPGHGTPVECQVAEGFARQVLEHGAELKRAGRRSGLFVHH